MLLGALFILCLASVPALGGRLIALADLRLRGSALLLAAIVTQVLIISVVPEGGRTLRHTAHLASYAAVLGFVWLNRAVPGIPMAAAGAILNAIAIAANGGVMPASPAAVEIAGLTSEPGFENSVPMEGATLAFLGDVFAVPHGWPLANVFSVGDVLLVLGALVGLHRLCDSRVGGWTLTSALLTLPGRASAGRR
jgi:hypothetical protein